MKEIRGINVPICWSGVRPRVEKDSEETKKLIEQAIKEGFTVTHITSSAVNDAMYVYHFLEREAR